MTHHKKGLTQQEVARLRKRYGFNEIQEKTLPAWRRFVRKFVGPIPLMIETALLLSALAKKWEDFTIITVLLIINVGVDFLQEQRAYRALEALKKRLGRKALVLREGVFRVIPARELVPGDIIKLKPGDVVPADVVLFGEGFVQVDQSALTGESLPVTRQAGEEVYGNAVVHKGEMLAEVKAIGRETYIGRSAQLVVQAENEEESHFQRAIIRIGNALILLSLLLIALVVVVALSRGDSLLETIRFALVLAVASIPVALPAVLSVTMAIGALAIARRKAIVSNLRSVEEIAGVDVLCTDKTGTLTKNRMTIAEQPRVYNGTEEELFVAALLASEEENHDPLEEALARYAKEHGYTKQLAHFQRVSFVPFDPVRKMTEARVRNDEGEVLSVVKGAPQAVAKLLANPQHARRLLADVEEQAKKGYRSLAVARKKATEEHFTLLGLLPLFDPPRDDSREVIAAVRSMGVRIKMLTGDNLAIARQIGKMLGIGSRILPASVLRAFQKTKSTDDDVEAIMNAHGFAEVFPEDKYRLVEALQSKDHIVAMTGDGVNDAPALKKADVGIAVSGATDAARSASDLVLLAPGLRVIQEAIRFARMTFARMQSYATFRIAETIRVVLFMTLSILLFDSYPVTAVMIIVLALLNDIPVMAIAYDNAPSSHKPVRWHLKETITVAAVLGVTGVISSFALFWGLMAYGVPLGIIQTMIFLKLDVAGHSTLYLTRTGRKHFWEKPYPSLKFFIPAFSSRLIGTFVAAYGFFMEPIGWDLVAFVWAYSLAWWFLNDEMKVLTYKALGWYHRRQGSRRGMQEKKLPFATESLS